MMNNTLVDELYAGEPKAEKEMSQRFRSHDLLDVLTDQGIQINAPNSRDTIFFFINHSRDTICICHQRFPKVMDSAYMVFFSKPVIGRVTKSRPRSFFKTSIILLTNRKTSIVLQKKNIHGNDPILNAEKYERTHTKLPSWP